MRGLVIASLAMIVFGHTQKLALADTYISDRTTVKIILWEQCSQDSMKGAAGFPEQDRFCYCFGNSLSVLLTDDELEYVLHERGASVSILKKEERAKFSCIKLLQPQRDL